MEKWNKSLRDYQERHHRENPSFSSTLLDAIYKSIDEGEAEEKQDQLLFYRETMRKQKQSNCFGEDDVASTPTFHRARTVENWMETRVVKSEQVIARRNSSTECDRRTRSSSTPLSVYSSSSSSDSSSGGGFSSSESESFYTKQRPKPIRTSVPSVHSEKTDFEALHGYRSHSAQTQKPKHENGSGKTKSKALRILYGELRKAKQPISPGAKLASFLNSLFNSGGNAKKPKVSNSVGRHESKSAQASSTCSSASSFSRSCLSKTPSSRSGAKRSVRFCPVSVIVDEDCRPCGHKNLHEGEHGLMAAMTATSAMQNSYGKNSNEELRFHVMQESRRVEEFARDLLKNYQKKSEDEFDIGSDDEDDDAASCTSSDLFELDNLSAIGIERYREELPVYETTHIDTNRAIANGFIL
ncbi:hypothetical protein L6164_004262 [Bauhinia variegata]|uniref:Uncharacterized protein n=1 Tax=Bauhinia variegata TaxID=167791 RepID=A0ACB9Q3V5_BAUVA|nr:hypothetical protein L6164_004262 [Bauhinia variegata]